MTAEPEWKVKIFRKDGSVLASCTLSPGIMLTTDDERLAAEFPFMLEITPVDENRIEVHNLARDSRPHA